MRKSRFTDEQMVAILRDLNSSKCERVYESYHIQNVNAYIGRLKWVRLCYRISAAPGPTLPILSCRKTTR